MYRIVEVPDDAADATEQLGSKPKFWFTDETGQDWLFKLGREGTGENWAEKISAEFCDLLQIPHALYELAVWRQYQGVVSRNFVPRNSRLVLGNELLGRFVKGYPIRPYYGQSDHTVSRVFAVLRDPGIHIPLSWEPSDEVGSAAEVFVGYLMLDALVGNTDRHHENWGLVIRPSRAATDIRLAPTFDHASSLGRNESDERRAARLATRDPQFAVAAYARRARSALYKAPRQPKPLTTFEAFYEAHRLYPKAARAWVANLERVGDNAIDALFEGVPPAFMTTPARDFARQILLLNRDDLIRWSEDIT